jgi:hypothetical protein
MLAQKTISGGAQNLQRVCDQKMQRRFSGARASILQYIELDLRYASSTERANHQLDRYRIDLDQSCFVKCIHSKTSSSGFGLPSRSSLR